MKAVEHALDEFKANGWLDEKGNYTDEMQQLMCEQVLELLELFGSHGHSGSSAPYAIDLFSTLAKFEPVGPITGADSEWIDHGGGMYQNKRCSHVFKQPDRFDGQAYDSEAVIFWEWYKGEDGEKSKSHYTCGDSRRPITFPYTPKRVYEERPSGAT